MKASTVSDHEHVWLMNKKHSIFEKNSNLLASKNLMCPSFTSFWICQLTYDMIATGDKHFCHCLQHEIVNALFGLISSCHAYKHGSKKSDTCKEWMNNSKRIVATNQLTDTKRSREVHISIWNKQLPWSKVMLPIHELNAIYVWTFH